MANPSPVPGPPGMPPGAMPPAGPPMGPPPGAPPLGMPPMAPPPNFGPSPQDPTFVDVSSSLDTKFQIIDIASRQLKKAIETGGFYQNPDVLQTLKDTCATLDRIVTRYSNPDGLDVTGSPMGDDSDIVKPGDDQDGDE